MGRACQSLLLALLVLPGLTRAAPVAGEPWARHTIDDSSHGADGARPADVNGDGLPDFAVAWEEGGVIRVYLHPGHAHARDPWPQVTVGRVAAPEDAVFADLNADGATDLVSATEGDDMQIYVHWAPKDPARYLDESAWETSLLQEPAPRTRWMYVLPRQGKDGRIELVAGSKNPDALVGLFRPGANSRDLQSWTFTPLASASWVMTLAEVDVDGKPRPLYSDRKDPATRGVFLEGAAGFTRLGGADHEVMFLGTGPLERGGPLHVVAATSDDGLLLFTPENGGWTESIIPLPDDTGTGKGVAIGDLTGDGHAEIVFSCEHAGRKHGVVYLQRMGNTWQAHAISGLEGVKFDQVELLDLDGDTDLDVITCEETTGLGVIWYENPEKRLTTNKH